MGRGRAYLASPKVLAIALTGGSDGLLDLDCALPGAALRAVRRGAPAPAAVSPGVGDLQLPCAVRARAGGRVRGVAGGGAAAGEPGDCRGRAGIAWAVQPVVPGGVVARRGRLLARDPGP